MLCFYCLMLALRTNLRGRLSPIISMCISSLYKLNAGPWITRNVVDTGVN